MNKLYIVGFVAVALFAFACAQDDVYSSDVSSTSQTHFSSSAFSHESSSSDVDVSSSESGSSAFPNDTSSSSSTTVECRIGQYEKNGECLPCSDVLNCYTCKDGSSCDSCSADYKLVDNICVVDCEKKYGAGCSRCNDRKCLKCEAQGCCYKMAWYWNATCMDPALVFGEGCLETDGVKCTKCTAPSCCGSGNFYDFSMKGCKTCSIYGESCTECVDGACLNCGDGFTVLSNGHCVECGSVYGSGCSKCNDTQCTEAVDGAVLVKTNAVMCNALFGASCLSCGIDGCYNCSEGYYAFDGYCKNCTEVFGADCTACDNNTVQCTECTGEGIVKKDGVCVSCDEAFGSGCLTCNETHCLTHKDKCFISNGYAFACSVLPEDIRADCEAGADVRDVYVLRDGEEGDFKVIYKNNEYPAKCSDLDERCTTCGVVESTPQCSACEESYVLYGGSCVSCVDIFGDHCAECSKTTCLKCTEGYNLTKDGKCVECSGVSNFFDAETKTCMECGTVYSHCEKCGADGCSDCGSEYVASEGQCKTCMTLYGEGCKACNETKCTDCKSDKCCDPETTLHVVGGEVKCSTCSSAFDEKCVECTMNECTKCDGNLIVDPIEHKCKECSAVFKECSECNADECLKCSDELDILTPNGCVAPAPVEPQSSALQPSSSPSVTSNPSVLKPLSNVVESSSKKSNGGMIAGIVIACIVVVAIVAIAVYCVVTSGKKKGKIDPTIYEDDPEFVSMSVL